MPGSEPGRNARKFALDARRLVDGQLLLDRQVHAHMQKRVGVARLGPVLPLLVTLGVVQHRVVFRMQQDDIDGEVIQPGQDLALTLLAPGIEEELPDLLAAGVEHGVRRVDWGGARSQAARVLALNSHRSAIAHCGHCGFLALHT